MRKLLPALAALSLSACVTAPYMPPVTGRADASPAYTVALNDCDAQAYTLAQHHAAVQNEGMAFGGVIGWALASHVDAETGPNGTFPTVGDIANLRAGNAHGFYASCMESHGQTL